MNDLQVESPPLYKPESSFSNIFPDFPKLLQVFKNLEPSLFYKVCTINGNALYYESHFACQFISKTFSEIKIEFHNSKVITRSFLFIIMGVKPLFPNFVF